MKSKRPSLLVALLLAAPLLSAPVSAQPRRPPPGRPVPRAHAIPSAPEESVPEEIPVEPPSEPIDVEPFVPPVPVRPTFHGAGGALASDFRNAVRILRVPGNGEFGAAEANASSEIFPDADKVFMQVIGTDPLPIEAARRGARPWLCSSGCALSQPEGGSVEPMANELLQSIKLQTPTNPLPLTIWQPRAAAAIRQRSARSVTHWSAQPWHWAWPRPAPNNLILPRPSA